ncbi:VanZ family protein [Lentibacillus halophilus]|uniref:VanZ family protein n=1 Tax=Lentibacillus halophilus TaxID=295065 RepID=A0ABP3IUK6_9BACI
MYKNISWTLVILWMALIFYLSNQPEVVSDEISTGVAAHIAETVEGTTSNVNIDLASFNHIVRKNAHFFIYFILAVLVFNALRRNGRSSITLALAICVLYATSDEIHQLFVAGRGPQVSDVLIDTAGASVGLVIYLLAVRIRKTSRRSRAS